MKISRDTMGLIALAFVMASPVVWFVGRMAGIPRPPRPMFHDKFVQADHGIFPFWRIVPPDGDDQATRVWTDPIQNLVVVILRVPPTDPQAFVSSGSVVFGTTQSILNAGSPDEVTVGSNERNTVMVIAPSGRVYRDSNLKEGAAERIHSALRSRDYKLSIVRALEETTELGADVRAKIDAMRELAK